jgi:death-on-curing protein
LAEHEGPSGIRDENILESALARPQNLVADGAADIAELAAAYARGIARNHPLVDGNKRSASVAIILFLALNIKLVAAQHADCVLKLAVGEITKADLATWIRDPSHTSQTKKIIATCRWSSARVPSIRGQIGLINSIFYPKE